MIQPYNTKFYQIIATRSAVLDHIKDTETDLAQIEPPIDWCACFGNDNPVEIEVGCGNGQFLLEAARRYPQTNYVGIERARKYANRARMRLMKYASSLDNQNDSSLSNALLVWSDAPYFIDRYVSDGSVRAYHVYFPDPWPKKRHHKRRLFRNKPWLEALIRTLDGAKGHIHIATDYAEYFHEIDYTLTHALPLTHVPADRVSEEHIPTNFEMKYQAEGRRIYRASYRIER